MVLVDDKGRVLGKFNIIDILVVIFIVLVIAIGVRFVALTEEPTYVTIEVFAEKLSLDIIKNIKAGSLIIGASGETAGRVLTADIIPSETISFKNMIMLLNISTTERGSTFFFQNQEININSKIKIRIGKTSLNDIKIINIGKSLDKERIMSVKVMIKDVDSWVAEAITVGDTEADSQGRIIAKINNKSVSPARMITVSETGEVLLKENPIRKDITLTFNIIARKIGETYVFHNGPLKIGSIFIFESPIYHVSGKIISVN